MNAEMKREWLPSGRLRELSLGVCRVLLVSVGVCSGAAEPSAVERKAESRSEIPMAYPVSRYDALLGKSPFALATAAPEPVAPVENFATNWVLGSLSGSRSSEKSDQLSWFATVKSRDLQTHMIVTEKPNSQGVSIDRVELPEGLVSTKAVVYLRKGSETGKVEFDQATVSAAASGAGAPGAPGAPGGKPGQVQPRVPIPRPGMSSQSRSGAAAPATGAGTVPAARGRVRAVGEAP
ncbi:MAG: hypothetical protein RLZZ244_590 [Verrucomicrobiota bacterium]